MSDLEDPIEELRQRQARLVTKQMSLDAERRQLNHEMIAAMKKFFEQMTESERVTTFAALSLDYHIPCGRKKDAGGYCPVCRS